MKNFLLSMLPWGLALCLLGVSVGTTAQDTVINLKKIYLKDGQVVECEKGWLDGDTIFYEKYGGTIGIPTSKVDVIKTITVADETQVSEPEAAGFEPVTKSIARFVLQSGKLHLGDRNPVFKGNFQVKDIDTATGACIQMEVVNVVLPDENGLPYHPPDHGYYYNFVFVNGTKIDYINRYLTPIKPTGSNQSTVWQIVQMNIHPSVLKKGVNTMVLQMGRHKNNYEDMDVKDIAIAIAPCSEISDPPLFNPETMMSDAPASMDYHMEHLAGLGLMKAETEFLSYVIQHKLLNKTGSEGLTPLFLAVAFGLPSAVEGLLNAGSDVTHRNGEGATVLMCAALLGQDEIVTLLLDRGAPVDDVDKEGMTALAFAAIEGRSAIAEYLLAAGAAVNHRDNMGTTALIYAAARGKSDIAQTLLKHGANPNIKAHSGETAYKVANQNGHSGILVLLTQHQIKAASIKVPAPKPEGNHQNLLLGKWGLAYDPDKNPKDFLIFKKGQKFLMIGPDGEATFGSYQEGTKRVELMFKRGNKKLKIKMRILMAPSGIRLINKSGAYYEREP